MTGEVKIKIENNLVMEKRDMNVYHHGSRSAHMISYNSSVTLPLKSAFEDDYLHISIVSGPGELKQSSIVNLPCWIDFEFSSGGNITVNRQGEQTLLKIPPGIPNWQLRLTRTTSPIDFKLGRVTIGDDQFFVTAPT